MTKLEDPGHQTYEDLIRNLTEIIKKENKTDMANEVPKIKEMILYHSKAAGQNLMS